MMTLRLSEPEKVANYNRDAMRKFQDDKDNELLNFNKYKATVLKKIAEIQAIEKEIKTTKIKLQELEIELAIYGKKPAVPIFEGSKIDPPILATLENGKATVRIF